MHIVIIDDEKILSASLQKKLEQFDYTVTKIHSYRESLGLDFSSVDLCLIDVSLWDGSGLDIIHSLKSSELTKNIPILIISGHDDVSTKVNWLDTWADDYIVKPFHPDELLARIRTLLRRSHDAVEVSSLTYKNIHFDTITREVSQKNENIDLAKKEKQILELFLVHTWKLIKKEEIIEKLWGKKSDFVTDNTVNVTICNLRKKLGSSFKLTTKIWEGYILEK